MYVHTTWMEGKRSAGEHEEGERERKKKVLLFTHKGRFRTRMAQTCVNYYSVAA